MMIRSKHLKGLLLMAILFFVLSGFIIIPTPPFFYKKYTCYQILSQSIFEVSGKTNINAFCCSSSEKFPEKKLEYTTENSKSIFRFNDLGLNIRVQELDCGGKVINKDLYNALKAEEYPEIKIELNYVKKLDPSENSGGKSWEEYAAFVDITITCNTESMKIPFQLHQLEEDRFRIIGSITIDFCDFGIDPPRALMGLIKVKDTIDINFDLFIELF